MARDRARRNESARAVPRPKVARRRSRERNAPRATVTPAALATHWEEIGAYACVACGAPYEHADHVQPLAKGGEHSVYNLLPLCAPCNLGKSDLDPFEWLTCNLGVDFRW